MKRVNTLELLLLYRKMSLTLPAFDAAFKWLLYFLREVPAVSTLLKKPSLPVSSEKKGGIAGV